METTTLTVRLSAELKEKLDTLAEHTQRTKSFLAAEAIADYVTCELAIIAGIERGLEDLRAGRLVPHEDAMRRIRATIDKARSST
jgi:predicted transcriptional regulator